jgi:protein-tyrosine phosphatase
MPPAFTPGADAEQVRPFGILYVCSANLCRSVLAERLTRLWIENRPDLCDDRFSVSSAGTDAVPGNDMPHSVARYLRRRGASTESFASRRLSPALVEQADMVLTASRLERDRVIATVPTARSRTFTINELARLAPRAAIDETGPTLDVGTRARSIMATALTLRGRIAGHEGRDDDVPDPTRGRRSFNRCATSIDSAVDTILEVFAISSNVASEVA